jgi:hypothetical protein
LKVNRNGSLETVEVTADGEGFCSQAGALLLTNLCDRLGLTEALGEALAPTRQRRSAHADGEILRDLVVTLVQGGEHVSDLATLRDQPDLFGEVASDSTAFRAIERIGPEELEGIKAARKLTRANAFALGAGPDQTVLDVDASLLGAHSEKEKAAGNYKGGALNPSTQRCLQGICRRLKAKGLPRPGVQLGGDRVELRLRELRQVGPLRQVLA